jgi:hypothetical protein
MLLVDGEPVLSSSATDAASRSVRTLLPASDALVFVRFPFRFSDPTYGAGPVCLSLQGAIGMELVAALAMHPGLRDAADRLKATPERRISAGQEGAPRHVYVFQREYATVDPARVEVSVERECLEVVAFLISPGFCGLIGVEQRNLCDFFFAPFPLGLLGEKKMRILGGYGGSFLCSFMMLG